MEIDLDQIYNGCKPIAENNNEDGVVFIIDFESDDLIVDRVSSLYMKIEPTTVFETADDVHEKIKKIRDTGEQTANDLGVPYLIEDLSAKAD